MNFIPLISSITDRVQIRFDLGIETILEQGISSRRYRQLHLLQMNHSHQGAR
jgi:hypothetical protein